MQRLNHLRLFEEIGFTYPGKGDTPKKGPSNDLGLPAGLPLGMIEKPLKQVASLAFAAGKTGVDFETWWSTTIGQKFSKSPTSKPRNVVGFKDFNKEIKEDPYSEEDWNAGEKTGFGFK
jgi:hypothetical protein